MDLRYGDVWEQARFTNKLNRSDFALFRQRVGWLAAFAARSRNGGGELGPIAKSKPVDGVVSPLTQQRDGYATQGLNMNTRRCEEVGGCAIDETVEVQPFGCRI